MSDTTIRTPEDFVRRWRGTTLGERQSYQAHFIDVCHLVQYATPGGSGKDPDGNEFVFEKSTKKGSGEQGYADVYLEGHFAIEYKAPNKYKDLADAYNQLLQYREKLKNPPLLIVTDIQNWEIHTNFPNTEKQVYTFTHEEITTRTQVRDWLNAMFYAPGSLHPSRNTEQVTRDAADVFEVTARNMRGWGADPERIAHFLTKIVFCLFAEDVNLLPAGPGGDTGIFSEIIERTRTEPDRFQRYVKELFQAMANGGEVLFSRIDYFNGALFDDLRVETVSIEALAQLHRASRLNWQSVEPAIFGTLFERSLDPAKRAQLGAHYTSREDILLIVEPVLMAPLLREWERVQAEAEPIRQKYDEALHGGTRRQQTNYEKKLQTLRDGILQQVQTVRVLDPACGSGNFLYVALQRLMDLEKEIITHELFSGLTRPIPLVHPRQMYGIEIDPIAHALASIVVWIGYIQWRKMNGYDRTFGEPILEDLSENIVNKDAILRYDDDGSPTEPQWADVDVIIGNPPFLGNKRMRRELGDEYVETLRELYEGRIPGGVDLVTYWFESARAQIEAGKAKRAGLLATNSIRAGANREVLERIKETGDIFMAWSDREWILEGAAVRVSMVGFDDGSEEEHTLDGNSVTTINADLTSYLDVTSAKILDSNTKMTFQGPVKVGAFDIPPEIGKAMLEADPRNAEVVKPYINGQDIVKRERRYWLIDFGKRSEDEAASYPEPFAHVVENVKPKRLKNKDKQRKKFWWRLGRSGEDYKNAVKGLKRQIFTPRVAKHRIFAWYSANTIPDSRVLAIARDDDYFFGVLHSKLHEVWSLRQASWHGKGNDPTYNNSTCFETFPFPWAPGQENTDHPAHAAISAAARQLHLERDAWLNPPDVSASKLKARTLTNLYNALAVFRGEDNMKIKPAAGDFAPRLAELHDALDAAVCDAYGFDPAILQDEEAMLRALLQLNLSRAGGA